MSDLATQIWAHPWVGLRAGLRRRLRPWVLRLEGQTGREWPQGTMLVSMSLRVLDSPEGKGWFQAERLNPSDSLLVPSTGGTGCQSSGARSLNTQPRVRVWLFKNGRRGLSVQSQALHRAQLRAKLWRPTRLRDCGVGVLGRCGWISTRAGFSCLEGRAQAQTAEFPRGRHSESCVVKKESPKWRATGPGHRGRTSE